MQAHTNLKRETKISLALLMFCATTAVAQTDAIYVAPSGKVGIGTSKPESALDVVGNIALSGTHLLFNSRYGVIDWGDGDAGSTLFLRALSKKGDDASYDDANRTVFISYNAAVGIGKVPTSDRLEVNGRIKDLTGYVTPVGGIIMYSGPLSDFDGVGRGKDGTAVQGWQLCNGQNGAPNLTDRFIVASGYGSTYTPGQTGGEATHTLTIEEMPKHNHQWAFGCNDWGGAGISGAKDGLLSNNPCLWGVTTEKGGNQPHENRPPFYALLFIMKK